MLNGIFSGAEIAVVSLRRTRVAELIEAGNRRARAVERLRSTPDRFFATVQIGITVVGSTAAALGGSKLASQAAPVFERLGAGRFADSVAFAVVVGGISFLSLVLGELVPKSLGIRYSETYALLIARPLVGLGKITRPLVWLLTFSSNLVLRVFGDKTSFSEGRMSADELQQLVEDAAKSGTVDTETSEIASRAFDLKDVPVAAVMVPRNRMVAIDRNASVDDLKSVVLESGLSRIPIKDGGLDNIVGYIVAKDLLALSWEEDIVALDDILRPAYFVPETMKTLDCLRELQSRALQMAIVVDERGTIAGLITVEDLIEELVGEIISEHELPVELADPMPDGRFSVPAGAPLRDVNRALGVWLPEGEGYTTLAGLAISLSGRIPQKGETFKLEDGGELEILDASPRRVKRIAVKPPQQRGDEENASEAEAPAAEEGTGSTAERDGGEHPPSVH